MNDKMIRGIAFDCYSDVNNDFDNLKFAELIIKECTNTIIKAYGGHINPKIAIEAVNNHFGIES